MNFRQWMEITSRNTPPPTSLNNRSVSIGSAGKFGIYGRGVPGVLNRAGTNVVGGVGQGVADAQKESGREASPSAGTEELPAGANEAPLYGHLPLQLPLVNGVHLPGLQGSPSVIEAALQNMDLTKHVRETGKAPPAQPFDVPRTGMTQEEQNEMEYAKKFTRSLIIQRVKNQLKNDPRYNSFDKGKIHVKGGRIQDGVMMLYLTINRKKDTELPAEIQADMEGGI
jgi:hypothetical protein